MPPKTSHTLRLGPVELEWLARNGRPLSRQLREDLALLRLLLDARDEDSISISQAVEMAQRLLDAQ